MKFSRIGDIDDIKVLAMTDAAYLKLEDKTKSVMGRILFLSNSDETRVVPLMWKSNCLQKMQKLEQLTAATVKIFESNKMISLQNSD